MIDALYSIDLSLFYFINRSMENRVFDAVVPFLTDLNKQPAILALVAALLLWMMIRGDRNVRLAALLLIPTILVSDQLNSSVIKFLIERPRPCLSLPDVHLLVGCGSGYSFPSSHAVNNFAAALVLSYFIPRGWWGFFLFATAVAFSRVYVGVHYPSDVVGGAIIGMAIGACILLLFRAAERLWTRWRMKSAGTT